MNAEWLLGKRLQVRSKEDVNWDRDHGIRDGHRREPFKGSPDTVMWQLKEETQQEELVYSRTRKTVSILNRTGNTERRSHWERKKCNKPGFQMYDFEIPEGKAGRQGYQEFGNILIALASLFLK